MRIGLGIPGRPELPSSAVVPGWLSDVLSLGPPAGGGPGNITTGINFTVSSPQNCTGIRACWSSINAVAIPVTLSLWHVGPNYLIASEVVTVLNGVIQTTGAFGSHLLSPGNSYAVSTYNPSLYDGYIANPFSLPRSYPLYDVLNAYSYELTYGANYLSSNAYCAYVEPVL